MLKWELLHPRMTLDMLGFIPSFLSDNDPEPAAKQFDRNYPFGGWDPFRGFALQKDNSLTYQGEPPMKPLAYTKLRDELIMLYPHAWVAIIQPDRSFEVCRMD